jgi:predicted exporter
VAGVAFASLGLSGLHALRELGVLCGLGEFLTAVAILLVTPEVGAWLERGAPPPAEAPRWIQTLVRATATRRRAMFALVACASPIAVAAIIGWPRAADALVAIRPRTLEPLAIEDRVRALFGGRPGQWLVLTADPVEEEARARADRIAEALEPLARAGDIDGFDAITTFAPAKATRAERLGERAALDLPQRAADLERALHDAGFDLDACAAALQAFAHPAGAAGAELPIGQEALSWLLLRHVGKDATGSMVATFVRPKGEPAADARARAAIALADRGAIVTGFDAIDRELLAALRRDLALVGGVSFAVVAVAMGFALRSAKHVSVALATLVCEMGAVGVAMRALSVRWHVYDALVLPVLFGVTIDESMFLLHATRGHTIEEALRKQGPLVAATALTTASGFAALLACRFDGLRDLGSVGAIGVLAGLVAALILVPAASRAFGLHGD